MVFTKLFDKTKRENAAKKRKDLHPSRSIGKQRPPENALGGKRQTTSEIKKKNMPPPSNQQPGASTSGRKREMSSVSVESSVAKKWEQHRPNKKKRAPPSEAALNLSRQLKELSNQKNLEEALKIFNDPSNHIDEHHTCIMVDCCSRCGDLNQAEAIVRSMESSGRHVNVETQTALLKGYSHSGQLLKAEALFEKMCRKNISNKARANIRSLNTVLRGCLWSAATPTTKDSCTASGGVVTSEKAWRQYKDLDGHTLDASSFEYSISLLAQALRVEDAADRIDEMKATLGVDVESAPSSTARGNHGDLESLAVAYLSLARAYALLGRSNDSLIACNYAHQAIGASREVQKKLDHGGQHLSPKDAKLAHRNHHQSGGKRSWRQDSESEGNNRNHSNSLFRVHRLSELEADTKEVETFCKSNAPIVSTRQLSRRLLTRLLILSGGGTTDLDSAHGGREHDHQISKTSHDEVDHSRALQRKLVNTVYFSFGLSKTGLLQIPVERSTLNRRECNKILGSVGLQGGVVTEGKSQFINFTRIFSSQTGDQKARKRSGRKRNRPIDLELGAGFGSWITAQARLNPSRDYVAVELRADRAWQIFARATMNPSPDPIDNLCVVGAESGDFLRNHVEDGTIETIFVNHPEPPTQTYGAVGDTLGSIIDGTEEPAHMLASSTLEAAGRCLSQSQRSRLVIVTDNRWYARLICATLVKVFQRNVGKFVSVLPDDEEAAQLSVSEAFPSKESCTHLRQSEKVVLFEGQPNKLIRHAENTSEGGSYFDRLWRTGAGTHAEQRTRYIIIVKRQNEEDDGKRC